MMLLYIFTIFISFASIKSEKIVIQLRPEQILKTFKSMVSSDYLRTLANEFAKKAADHLINEMKNQEKQFTLDDRSPAYKTVQHSTLINKEQVLTLLREPSPDGDNLEAELVLSDEETKTIRDSGPKVPMKINGAYFKRFG